ncbi:M24 family metallopeptidase [Natronorubrum halophilum]|uniref:M24 family metallopeptidase n=1 Tax=Natronorubrum halophilum TaxID=1702106 RepID=UPI000EF743AB|nr:M24 family metallopeptidase [Natronorubrum halophilum]
MEHPALVKRRRVADALAQRSLEELWLCRPENVAWLGGGDVVVDAASEIGVAALGVPADGGAVRLLAPNNELDRIREEEVPALEAAGIDVEVDLYEWHESSLPAAVADRRQEASGADVPIEGVAEVDPATLRTPLPAGELERYETASLGTAQAVETVASELTGETTEREAAAALRRELTERGFAAPVVLVGGSERSLRHRHFTPTTAPLDRFGHLTVVAERGGHNVAVTRTVAFDPPEWLRERHDAACRVAATAAAATLDAARTGGTAADVFDAIRTAYDELGYRGEWRSHHQGGAIGYESREWTADPASTAPVLEPLPYAWNPTVQGAKCEDTILVDAERGVDVLTSTGDWPTTRYDPVGFDDAVAFHDPLEADP